jgi:hypothetical protein
MASVAIPSLITMDALVGLAYRTGTNVEVQTYPSRSGTTRRSIVIFPGYIMSGHILGDAFAPYVRDDDAMVVVNYAERGIDLSQIYEKVMAEVRILKPSELRLYGASMGGMVGKLFLDRYRQAGSPYGKVTFILDSAPAYRDNVKRPLFLFNVSCWYRGGPLSSAAWAAASEFGTKPPMDNSADMDIVHAARRAGAWVGMPALTSQACFIAHFDALKAGELLDVAQQVVFLEGSSPDDDPLIRITDATKGWRIAFQDLLVLTVRGREGRWHLPLVEYPRETVRSIIETRY